MLTEVTKEEALSMLVLGDMSFGLVVHTKGSGVVFENLKVQNNKCLYYSQEDTCLATWSSNSDYIEVCRDILNLSTKHTPSDWLDIIHIYHIDESL